MNDANQKADQPENNDLNNLDGNLDGMAKAFIVQVAWSYAEALERTKRHENQQKPVQKSQPKSPVEPDDRTSENN